MTKNQTLPPGPHAQASEPAGRKSLVDVMRARHPGYRPAAWVAVAIEGLAAHAEAGLRGSSSLAPVRRSAAERMRARHPDYQPPAWVQAALKAWAAESAR